MLEAIAQWYLGRQAEKRELEAARQNMAVVNPTSNLSGLQMLNRDRYNEPRRDVRRNMMLRVVAIRNGFLVCTDDAPFENIDFCRDTEEVAQAVAKSAACHVMEK